MKLTLKVLTAVSVATCSVVSIGASAQTYDLNFGPTLKGQITTAPTIGASRIVTGITGSFMGQAITNLSPNPFAPTNAYFSGITGVTSSTNTDPSTITLLTI